MVLFAPLQYIATVVPPGDARRALQALADMGFSPFGWCQVRSKPPVMFNTVASRRPSAPTTSTSVL